MVLYFLGLEEKGAVKMACCQKARKIYYQILEGSQFLLADERDKRKLLDILCATEREEGWLIYAFCLTDECAYLVIEADGICSVRRGGARAAKKFLGEYRADPAHPESREATLECGNPKELDSLWDIAAHCRKIHRLPLEKGYVSRLDDYWWSSYITYTGEYEWKLVDCRIFMLYFSANPEIAKHRLLKFHQQASC